MKKSLLVSILVVLIGGFFASSVVADDNHHRKHDDTLVKFKGGIGVVPISNVALDGTTGAVVITRNMVRGVNSPGQIWRITDLKAEVKDNGRIKVDGRGLLLAGGNNIGTNANAKVFATLICEALTPFTLHNTDSAGVPLEADGDFRIDDLLTPALPVDCESPVLLIRTAGSGNWFAAGILDPD